MPGSMYKVLAIAGLLDDIAARAIHLPALQWFVFGQCGFTQAMAASRPAATMLKTFVYFSGTWLPVISGPGEVAIHGTRLIEFGPKIDEHELIGADFAGIAGLGFVMRIARMRSDADNWRVVASHPIVTEVPKDAFLHFEFVDRTIPLNALGDELPTHSIGRPRVDGRRLVHRPLFVVPGRFEQLNEIAGRDHFDAKRTHQFNRAGIDT